ncbi:MAG: sialidase family protein, partial [Armatimonadota bacterium]|nr:sialidase family protein [Armatimonadota bacterium]
MGRLVAVAVAAVLMSTLLSPSGFAQRAGQDVKVSDQRYVRHDGGSDRGIQSCSDDRTPTGGGNRQQNEPTVAINPFNPQVIAAGANDYCGVATWGEAWMGFYISQDGGRTWVNSLNPGYPADTSTEGQASPIFGEDFAAGDPIMAWDTDRHLFYGGIAFNRTQPNASGFITPTNGHVIVSTWKHDPTAPLGMDYLRTVIVGVGTPSAFFFGRFNDKPSLKVDTWEGSPHHGNVYVSWTLFPGAGQDQILFSRSTDHGVTFSAPIKISKDIANAQGSDIAVAPDGTVYVVWRQFAFLKPGVVDAIMFVKSTDGGRTFTAPQMVAAVTVPYDRRDRYDDGSFARDCGDGPFH